MQMADKSQLKLMGAPGLPYTRKMLALMRYRRIPYAVLWGGYRNPPADLPQPKVKLLPTFPYQARCLQHLRKVTETLPESARSDVRKILSGTGCEEFFG